MNTYTYSGRLRIDTTYSLAAAKAALDEAQRRYDAAVLRDVAEVDKSRLRQELFGSNDDYEVGAILVVTKTFVVGGLQYTYLLRKHSTNEWTHTAVSTAMQPVRRFADIVDFLLHNAPTISVELVTETASLGGFGVGLG